MILSTISKAGFTAGTFQVSQVLLDRSKDLYEHLMDSKKKLTELLQELDKEKENNKKLMKELKSKEEIIKVNQNISNNANKPSQSLSSNPSDAFR